MRTTLLILFIVVLTIAGYAYVRNPSGSTLLWADVVAVPHAGTAKLQADAGPFFRSLLTISPAAPSAQSTDGTPSIPPSAPAAPPAPAPPPAVAEVPAAAAPPPVKPWTPPNVLPAQANWSWTTLDGTTYNNVVVTKITPDTVSFTHSMGVAHDVPITNLPPAIQQKLSYNPVAAAAARKETQREDAHPYYALADLAEAQAVARQLHWPLAFICTDLALLSATDAPDSPADLSQRAVSHLNSRAIVILINGNDELVKVPRLILNQFFVLDDGPMPGGHHFYAPKVVLADADMTKTYGRISHTQLIASGNAAFDQGLADVADDSSGPTPVISPGPSVPAPAPTAAISPTTTAPPAASPVTASAAPPPPEDAQPWAPPSVMPAQANWTWTTLDGTTYQNVVVNKIESDTVSITHSLGVAHIPMNILPHDLQKQLNYDPRAASQVSALIAGKLIGADGTAVDAPPATIQYYAIYYSAQWCPPCHAFTPHLVKWYNAFKPAHPNFELIFVSEDHDEASMLGYMKEMAMPWPAVRFAALLHDGGFQGSGIEKFANKAIPDLVLVDAGGNVLSDSFQNGTYVGPGAVIDDVNRIVGGTAPIPLTSL